MLLQNDSSLWAEAHEVILRVIIIELMSEHLVPLREFLVIPLNTVTISYAFVMLPSTVQFGMIGKK